MPRKKRPNRSPDEKEAARAEHAGLDKDALKLLTSRTTWRPEKLLFFTSVRVNTDLCCITSFSYPLALEADRAAVELANAHASLETVRAKKRQRIDERAEERAGNVAKYGGNSELERSELYRIASTLMVHPKAVETGLTVQLMPDGCHADALFRVAKMPPGKFLEWQHKSTRTAVDTSSSSNDNVSYNFSACAGYDNCLIVLSVKAEEEIFWAVRGSEITERDICISHNWKEFEYTGLGGDSTPIGLEGLLEVLLYEASEAVTGRFGALPMFSMEEAEEELGSTHLVERHGILDWARCLHGGFALFTEMSLEMQNDSRTLRQTKDGTVFQYPREQNSKVDLHILLDWQSENGGKINLQFKTAYQPPGNNGYVMDLATPIGGQLVGNVYTRRDNDRYIAVLPSTGAAYSIENEIHIWNVADADMEDHGLLSSSNADLGLPQAYLYRSDTPNRATKYGWTEKCHLSFAVDGATTTPTNDAAREALANLAVQRPSKAKEEAIMRATTKVRKMRERAKEADEGVSMALAAAIEAMSLVTAAEQTLLALQEAE